MEQLVQSSLRIAVARLCLGHGWHSADADCVHALTDALHLYLLRLCGSVADLCELRRLQSPQLADILRALSEAGLDEPDAREYLMACAKLAPFPRAFPACPVRRPDELNWPSEAELKAESEAGDRPEHLPDHLPPRRRADAEDVEASESAADTLAVDDVDELNVTDGGKSVSVSSQAASPQKLLQQPRDCYGNRVAPSRFAMRTAAMTTDGRVVPLNSRQSGVAPSSRPPPETFRSRPRPHPDRRRTAEPLGHDWLNSGSDSEPDVGTGPGASGVGAASGVLRRGDLGTDSVGLGGDSLDNLTANAATAQSATAASDISGGGGSGDSNDSADRGVVISRRDPLGGGSGGEDGGESAAGALAAAAAAQSRFANNLDEILDNLDQVDVDSDKERDIFDFVLSGKKSAAAAVAEPRPEPPAAAAAPAAVSRKPSAARGRRKQAAISRAASAKSPPPPAAAAPSPPAPSAPVADAPGQPSPHDRFAFIGGDATDSNFSVSVGRTGGGSPDSTDTLPAVNPDDSGHRRSPTPPPSLTPSAAAAAAISPPLRVKLKLPQQPPPPQEEPLDSPSAVRHFLFDSPPRSDSKIEADDAVSPPADVDGKGEHEEAPEAEVSPADNLGGFEFDDNAVDEPFADAQDATTASAAVSPTKLSSKSGKKHRHRSPSKTPAPPPPPPHSPVAVPKLTIRLGGAFSAAVEAAPAPTPAAVSPPLPMSPPPPPPPPVSTQSLKLKISIGGVRVVDADSSLPGGLKSPPPPLSPAMPVLSAESIAATPAVFSTFDGPLTETAVPPTKFNSGRSRAGRSRPKTAGARQSAADAASLTRVQHEASYYFDDQGNQIWLCPACSEEDDGSLMIGCSRCDDWYHAVCLGFAQPPPEDEDWLCPKCRGAPVHRVTNRAELMARAEAGLPLSPLLSATSAAVSSAGSHRPPPNKKRRR